MTLRLVGVAGVQTLQLVNGRGVVVASKALAEATSVQITGGDLDDALTVDLSEWFSVPVTFDGRSQSADGADSLHVKGGGRGAASYVPDIGTPGQGAMTVGDNTLDFTGLESVTISDMASLTFTTPGSADELVIDSPAPEENRVSGTSDGVAFQAVTFFNIPGVSIDTGTNDGSAADDRLTVQSGLVAAQLENLSIRTGAGADTVVLDNTDLRLPGPGGVFAIDAGMGLDVIRGPPTDATWNILGTDLGTLETTGILGFTNVEHLQGGAGDDMFVFAAAGGLSGVLNGGAGADTLVGANVDNTWLITGANAGTLNDQLFIDTENLIGGEDADRFVFFTGGSISGAVDGRRGLNTFDYSALAGGITVNLSGGTATGASSVVNLTDLIGGTGRDILVGPTVDSSWILLGADTGSVGAVAFTGIEDLGGGSSSDTFLITSSGSLSGELTGGLGVDTLMGADEANTWEISAADAGAVNGLDFSSFENLYGGALADLFVFALAGSISGAISGGFGTDRVWGADKRNRWVITGASSAILDGVSLYAVEQLQAGSPEDEFVFAHDANGSGGSNGTGGVGLFEASSALQLNEVIDNQLADFLDPTKFPGGPPSTPFVLLPDVSVRISDLVELNDPTLLFRDVVFVGSSATAWTGFVDLTAPAATVFPDDAAKRSTIADAPESSDLSAMASGGSDDAFAVAGIINLDERPRTSDLQQDRLFLDQFAVPVVNGGVDLDSSGAADGDDDGPLGGPVGRVTVFNGLLDLNGDGVVGGSDDGTYRGFAVIDGRLDVDGDGTIEPNGDDDGVIGGLVGSAHGLERGLGWPRWLRVTPTLQKLFWNNFRDDLDYPNPRLKMSATFTFINTGNAQADAILDQFFKFGGAVTGVQFDLRLYQQGKFAVVDLESASANVAITFFSLLDIRAAFTVGLVKVDAGGNVTEIESEVADRILFGALRGRAFVTSLPFQRAPTPNPDGSTPSSTGVGFGFAIGFSEFGPLQGFFESAIPILIDPTSTLSITNIRGGITFGSTLPDITDPEALRGPEFKETPDLTVDEWEARLRLAVANQAKAAAEARLQGLLFPPMWFVLTEPMRVEGGATLFFMALGGPELAPELLSADVSFIFDTEGRILIKGVLHAAFVINIPSWLYLNFSDVDVTRPDAISVTMLALFDFPEIPQDIADAFGIKPLLTARGALILQPLKDGLPLDVDPVEVTDAFSTPAVGGGFQVTYEIDPSRIDEFQAGTRIIVRTAVPRAYNGEFVLTGVDQLANTITLRVGATVIDGLLDLDFDGDADVDDDGTLAGVVLVTDGRIDVNGDGTVNANDDAGRSLLGFVIIDGQIDRNGNGVIDSNDDDQIGIGDPGDYVGGARITLKDDEADAFEFALTGGVDFNIPFVTTISLDGEVMLTFTFDPPPARVDFRFDGALRETHVGNIGRAVGALHEVFDAQNGVTLEDENGNPALDPNGNPIVVPRVEVWGGATLDTDFAFLHQLGIFATAEGVLRLNSTDETKFEVLPQLTEFHLAETDVAVADTGSGFEVTVTLGAGTAQFAAGDLVLVKSPDNRLFDGAFMVSAVDTMAGTISYLMDSDPGVWVGTRGSLSPAREVELLPESFTLRADGSLEFRIDFDDDGFESGERVFVIAGAFAMQFSRQGFDVAVFREDPASPTGVGPATLQIGPPGATFLQFDVFGVIAIRTDTTFGQPGGDGVNNSGFAANLVVVLDVNAPGMLAEVVDINGQFVVVINTTFEQVSFKIPVGADQRAASVDLTVAIPRGPPASITSIDFAKLLTGDATAFGNPVTLTTAAYVLVYLGGTHPSTNPNAIFRVDPFELSGKFSLLAKFDTQFFLEIQGDFSFNVTGGSITLLSLKGVGFLRFDTSGLVGAVSLDLQTGFTFPSSTLGFNLNASFSLEINTTSNPVVVPFAGEIEPGVRVHADGVLTVLTLTLTGDFDIGVASDRFTIGMDARVSIFGASLDADGFAGVFFGANPGLAFSIQLRVGSSPDVVVSPAPGFTIAGTFQLSINTSGAVRDGIAAHSGQIAVTNVIVNLFGFNLSGSLIIGISSSGFGIDVPSSNPLTLDFFGLATLSVSGSFTGNPLFFSFTASGGITIGDPNSFGVAGSISVGFSSSSGFTGTVSGQVAAFGVKVAASGAITISGTQVRLTIHVSATLIPAIDIDIDMPWPLPDIHIHTPAVTISADAVFILGATTDAPDPAPPAPPPPELATPSSNGTLQLNLGVDVAGRGDQYGPELQEHYIISRVGPGSSSGEKLRVSAFGFEQIYDNVSKIVVNNTQNGHDHIEIRPNVQALIEINKSVIATGNNHFITGAGFATIGGGTGSNTIEIGSGGGTYTVGAGSGTFHSVTDNSGGNLNVQAPGFSNYQLTDQALVYGSNIMTFTGVTTAVLDGAANASYAISFADGQAPWTGNATLNGQGASSTIQATTDGNFTLTDPLLTASTIAGQVQMSNIEVAELSGDTGHNMFTVSGWTGTGEIGRPAGEGGEGGNDTVIASNNVDFTLSDTALARSGRGTLTLNGIEAATLEAGVNLNQFTVSSWTGIATLDGKGAGDAYTIHLNGSGASVITIDDSGSGGMDTAVVNGTAGANIFTLDAGRLTLGTATEELNYRGLEEFTLNSLGQNDQITILDTHAGLVTVNAGDGDDIVTIQHISGPTTINTGTGADAVAVNALGLAAALTIGDPDGTSVSVDFIADTTGLSLSLTSNGLSGSSLPFGISYAGVGTLAIDLGSDDDVFNIQGTGASTLLLDAGAGDDTVNVGTLMPATGGTVDDIDGLLVLNGGPEGGIDQLNVDDTGDTSANSAVLSAVALTGLGMASGITYNDFEDLNLGLGSGSDVLTIQSTHPGSTQISTAGGGDTVNVRTIAGATTIDTGSAPDTVNVGSVAPAAGGTVNDIDALLTVNGGPDVDTLNVDDTGDTAPNTGTLTATTLTGLDMAEGIVYGTLEHLNVSLGDGDNSMTVEGTSAVTKLYGGAGADVFRVTGSSGSLDGLLGELTIDARGGTNTLIVSDAGDPDPDTNVHITEHSITGLAPADINYAATGGSFAGGITISAGSGGNEITIESTHQTAGVLTITLVNSGQGSDQVTVTDTAPEFLVIDAQGGDDTVDASASTRPVTLFGGAGNDSLTGGSASDMILGDRGRVVFDGPAGIVLGGFPSETNIANPTVSDSVASLETVVVEHESGGADTIDGRAGDDLLLGGGADDVIAGGDGADTLVGDFGRVTVGTDDSLTVTSPTTVIGAGDDEMSGDLGDDTLYGEGGHDTMLGDSGLILREDRLNPNGAVHRDVQLTDVGMITGRYDLDGLSWSGLDASLAASLVNADLLLLTGAYNADGSRHMVAAGTTAQGQPRFRWDTELLMITLVADGSDALVGGAGDDAMYGGRGNDVLQGNSGQDYLEGDLGDDRMDGGGDDDQVVGDRSTVLSPDGAVPNVLHALRLTAGLGSVDGLAGIMFDIGGTTVAPMVSVTPGHDVDPLPGLLAAIGGASVVPAENVLMRNDGTGLVAFASVVSDVRGHLDLVAGNDTLAGGAGNDTIVGDGSTVLALSIVFTTDLIGAALNMTADLVDASDALADLTSVVDHVLSVASWRSNIHRRETVVDQVLTIAGDVLDGGPGLDLLVGDDNIVLAVSFTVSVGLTGDLEDLVENVAEAGHELEHAVLDLDDIQHLLRDDIVQVMVGGRLRNVLRHHVDQLLVGHDSLSGADGNDMLVGDHKFHLASSVTVTPGGSPVGDGPDDDDDDDDHDHHGASDIVILCRDILDGGAGNDLIFGDSQAVIAPAVLTVPGVTDEAIEHAWDAIEDLTEICDHLPFGWWDHHDGDDDEDDALGSNDDLLIGGDGDDVLLGQKGRDTLLGGVGDDYLVGGADADVLDGGPGKNVIKNGNDTSSNLAALLRTRLIDWAGHFSVDGNSPGLRSPSPWVPPLRLHLDNHCNNEVFVITP